MIRTALWLCLVSVIWQTSFAESNNCVACLDIITVDNACQKKEEYWKCIKEIDGCNSIMTDIKKKNDTIMKANCSGSMTCSDCAKKVTDLKNNRTAICGVDKEFHECVKKTDSCKDFSSKLILESAKTLLKNAGCGGNMTCSDCAKKVTDLKNNRTAICGVAKEFLECVKKTDSCKDFSSKLILKPAKETLKKAGCGVAGLSGSLISLLVPLMLLGAYIMKL